MTVYSRAGSLIPIENFARGGLWPAEKQPDTTPALHKPVVEEAEPQAPSALHPRIEAPSKRRVRRAPVAKPPAKKAPPKKAPAKKAPAKATQPPAELVEAFEAATDAMADAIRTSLEPRIKAAAQRLAAKTVADIFGGSKR